MALVPMQTMDVEAPAALHREFDDPALIQRLLQEKLSPEEISLRDGQGGKVPYVEGWRLIDKAQRIFGFDGWSSKVMEMTKEFEEKNSSSGRWCHSTHVLANHSA